MQNYNFKLDLESKNTMSVMISWIRSHTSILEFGPANGRLTKYLKLEKRCHVTIVEIDEEAGKEAAQYAKNAYIGMAEGDIRNFYWKAANETYDYIIFADVLEHLPDPSLILNECRQVLKEDGEILVSIPNIAHNSILISLFQDQFTYADTGLLDQTHLHFFTYHSFVQMVNAQRYHIVKQDVIYSRVGWNEIEASYMDVPSCVEREFKSRRAGSVYQYIFSLKNGAREHGYSFSDIRNLEEGEETEKEASCYLLTDNQSHSIERIGSKYMLHSKNKLHFEIHKKIQSVRLDLLEESALVCLNRIVYQCSGEEEKQAELLEHNAKYAVNNIYFFTTQDPWFVFRLPSPQLSVEYMEVEFCMLDIRMGESAKSVYCRLFEHILSFLEGDRFSGSYVQKYLFRDVKQKYEDELEDARQYQRNLEQRIDTLQKALEDAKTYQCHLEQDVAILQQESMRIREESEAFAKHLQDDIKSLKNELARSGAKNRDGRKEIE